MAAVNSAPRILTLRGAPDTCIDSPNAKPAPVQVMQLDLTTEIADELVRTVRLGKSAQVFFGRTPTLRFGTKTIDLKASKERFENELYRADGHDAGKALEYQGRISTKLAVKEAERAAASADAALEQLKNSLAAIQQEKDARKTTILTRTPNALNPNRQKGSGRSSQSFALSAKAPNRLNQTRPVAQPPANSQSPSLGSAGNLAPSKITDALRIPLLHLLAIKPATTEELAAKTRSRREQCALILPKIARQADAKVGQWQLIDRAYKELDVWKFPYQSQEVRQAVIDLAVRAFDRMRLSREDKLWQMLLPKEERGKGKILSRLNLHLGPVASRVNTPLLKPKADARGRPSKKADEKKNPDEKEGKGDAIKGADEVEARTPKTGAKAAPSRAKPASADVKAERKTSGTAPATKPAKAAAKSPAVPSQSRIIKGEASKGPQKYGTASARTSISSTGSTTSKPKIPSPLSASPMVPNDVSNETSPAASRAQEYGSSSQNVKRKASGDLYDGSIANENRSSPNAANKQQKTHGRTASSATSTSSLSQPSNQESPTDRAKSLKRKTPHEDDQGSTKGLKALPKPVKQPRLDNANKAVKAAPKPSASTTSSASISPTQSTKRPPSSSAVSSSDAAASSSSSTITTNFSTPSSSTSPPLPMSFRQTVEHAQKFKRYYERYLSLYTRLAGAPDPPSATDRRQLLGMHEKLSLMKMEIGSGALSQ